jgi:uncharacterized lipoprotein YddW (UPF0748 family)
MPPKKEAGCGCSRIPLSVLVLLLGGGYWGFSQFGSKASDFLANSKIWPTSSPTSVIASPSPNVAIANSPAPPAPSPQPLVTASPSPGLPIPIASPPLTTTRPAVQQKAIRGIYLSRYQITNNADEQTIRDRVRYYHDQGFNTIIHGVWGNGCTMYNSQVLQQTFGFPSCSNQFQERWLEWLIDEAHKQGMQVHAYFEKGIKIDKNSPIFDLAIAKRWIVPGVDHTYPSVEHYVLDVEVPEVANLFKQISVEFVKKYPTIDAVQWDDYLGYHADLPGKVDRTTRLTKFVQGMIADIKKANPAVSFDLCHHNPYWAKRYFAADWENWPVDRVFIQAYNDANFKDEVGYIENYAGIALADNQLNRLKEVVNNPKIKNILIFPTGGKPEAAAAAAKKLMQ